MTEVRIPARLAKRLEALATRVRHFSPDCC